MPPYSKNTLQKLIRVSLRNRFHSIYLFYGYLVDPATSISFPNTIRVPSKVTVAPLSLLGLGVRTVSFLGIKVYSVAFYADLANPNLKVTSLRAPCFLI